MRVFSFLAPAVLRFAFHHVVSASNDASFHPDSYPKHIATCKAVNRAVNHSTQIDIKLHYVDINPEAKTTLIMAHGWPSLWSTWSYQIQEFKNDYHLIVPDLRGFGSSTHPDDVESSGTMGDMVGDLVCILEHAAVTSAICVGHDWGAQICYEAARMRPDIFKAVAALVIPYIPSSGPFIPIAKLVIPFPALAYQLFFEDHTAAAVVELGKNITRTTRATLRTVDSPPPAAFLKSKDSYLSGWDDVDIIPPVPFFTAEEEDYLIAQYAIQGYRNTLQFYTKGNKYLSWEFGHKQGNHTIPQPVLAVIPLQDPVGDWVIASNILHSADYLPNLKTVTLDGAHWIHLEQPVKVNSALKTWLDELPLHAKGISTKRPSDEL